MFFLAKNRLFFYNRQVPGFWGEIALFGYFSPFSSFLALKIGQNRGFWGGLITAIFDPFPVGGGGGGGGVPQKPQNSS